MAGRHASFFIVLFFISQLSCDNASQQCGAGGSILARCDMKTGGLYKTWFLAFLCRANEWTFLNVFFFPLFFK